ncbi:hypothetical protein J3R30DRAFT_1353641 [Lentinula aciculospora]|uniref:Uncharacterized protein n=1 Tax=Lentinula aciculospora TaxID=153920 RepID=A0A9W9AN46_9AGAR|nr:hypothetical protein J3R30DRAFT_1353641 [Lentinula aciculospora]
MRCIRPDGESTCCNRCLEKNFGMDLLDLGPSFLHARSAVSECTLSEDRQRTRRPGLKLGALKAKKTSTRSAFDPERNWNASDFECGRSHTGVHASTQQSDWPSSAPTTAYPNSDMVPRPNPNPTINFEYNAMADNVAAAQRSSFNWYSYERQNHTESVETDFPLQGNNSGADSWQVPVEGYNSQQELSSSKFSYPAYYFWDGSVQMQTYGNDFQRSCYSRDA